VTACATAASPPTPPSVGRRALAGLLALAVAAGGIFVAGCGGGDDSGSGEVAGTEADDKLTGTDANDKLDGKEGEDVVQGEAGNDEITGGDDPDFLYGGDGDDRFLASEDDAVDVHDCGAGEDVVTEPDARDQLFPTCETAHWTNRPPSEPYTNTMSVAPRREAGALVFDATCPDGCTGVIELRTPNDRKLLGEGRFDLAAGEPGTVRATVTRLGEERLANGYVRVVLRSDGVNSGFNTFIEQ
jgi:RTX calcium-binding nonapeptide repeat (4 copies)